MLSVASPRRFSTLRFNPRPAVRPGDANIEALLWGDDYVSIRARP